MTVDEAQRVIAEIIGRGISAATEILRIESRPPEEMLKLSQELADSLIRSADEIAHGKNISATRESFAPSENMKPVVVSASEILSAYRENSVVADRKYECYEGKFIMVMGKIAAISENSKNDDNYAFRVTLEGGINCYFHRKHESDILTLKAGRFVLIAGIWHREKNYGGRSLEECQLITVQPKPGKIFIPSALRFSSEYIIQGAISVGAETKFMEEDLSECDIVVIVVSDKIPDKILKWLAGKKVALFGIYKRLYDRHGKDEQAIKNNEQAIKNLEQLMRTVAEAVKKCGADLKPKGLILDQYDSRLGKYCQDFGAYIAGADIELEKFIMLD